MQNRIKIIIIVLVSLNILFINSCKKTEKLDYNVVLIVIDTLRADHLPFNGYRKNTAPFLNELSKKSIVFKHAFSASSWTSPATASIFTSLYPFQHGVLMGLLAIKHAKEINPNIKVNKIPEKITTITEVLKENGYKTYGISDNLNIGKYQGFTQGFDKFKTFGYKGAPVVNNEVLKWKNEILNSGKYFLFIQYMDPHAPYHRRAPWYRPRKDWKEDRISAYDSEISSVDDHIKKLFNTFKWTDNTLFIVTSDHGEGLWEHGHMGHGVSLYKEEIHVPLLIYFKSEKNKARKIYTVVSTIDILPTVRELLGLPFSKLDEGKSLVPLIKGRKNKLNNRFIFTYLWKKVRKEIEFKSTIYRNWHFIISPNNKRRLFDWLENKKEHVALNKFKQNLKLAKQMEDKFMFFFKNCRKYNKETINYKLTKDKLKKLKSLGYVQ